MVVSTEVADAPLMPYRVAVNALRAIADYQKGTPNASYVRAMHQDIIGIAERALKKMGETL